MSEENLILLIFYLATLGATIYLFTKSFNAYSERDKSAQSPKGDYETSDWHYTFTYLPRADVKAKLIGEMEDEELDKDVTIKERSEVGEVEKNLTKKPDMVNHPSHYQGVLGLEAREVHKNFVPKYEKYGVMVASDIKDSIKYILRAPDKNGVQDIDKAINMLKYARQGIVNHENNQRE